MDLHDKQNSYRIVTIRERVWTTLTPNESPILKKVGTHAVVFLINPDSKKILKIPKYQM